MEFSIILLPNKGIKQGPTQYPSSFMFCQPTLMVVSSLVLSGETEKIWHNIIGSMGQKFIELELFKGH